MAGASWNCCLLGARSVFIYRVTLFNRSHIRSVHVCFAVTCHLHFWQNDRDLLCATAVLKQSSYVYFIMLVFSNLYAAQYTKSVYTSSLWCSLLCTTTGTTSQCILGPKTVKYIMKYWLINFALFPAAFDGIFCKELIVKCWCVCLWLLVFQHI